MNLQELQSAVAVLTPGELRTFSKWFEAYLADVWDRRIEADIAAGRLEALGEKADEDFEAGLCRPL